MRISFICVCATAVAALSLPLLGCDSGSTGTSSEKIGGTPPPLAPEAGHDDHEGREHGDEAGHEHPAEGPHGGHLIELGNEEYHAELLHDESTHTVTVYLLDAAGKQPVAISEPQIALQLFQDGQFMKYDLTAAAGPADAAGAASQFQIVDAGLCDRLTHDEETTGRLQMTITGKPYTGTIEHSSHGDHDHEGHDHAGHEH